MVQPGGAPSTAAAAAMLVDTAGAWCEELGTEAPLPSPL